MLESKRMKIRATFSLSSGLVGVAASVLIVAFFGTAYAQDQEGVLVPPFAPGVADFHQGGDAIGVGPPLQFSDEYYLQNGIDAVEIRRQAAEVPQGPPNNAGFFLPGMAQWVEYETDDPRFANVGGTGTGARQKIFNMGFSAAGDKLFYPDPPAFFFETAFLDQETRDLADRSIVYIFPRQIEPENRVVGIAPDGASPGNPFICPGKDDPDYDQAWPNGYPFAQLNPAPCFRRQDNLFDTGLGYLGNNPLALWRITFVVYDGPDVNGPECQALMADIEARNGLDEDGTPLIKRTAEVKALASIPASDPTVPGGVVNPGGQRCVSLNRRATENENGPASPTNPIDGPPWIV
jgi:hypothetical protein